MLQDGNCTLYPLLRNSTQTFTDPRWFELVPVQSVAAYTESLATIGGPACRNKITIVAVALQVSTKHAYPVAIACIISVKPFLTSIVTKKFNIKDANEKSLMLLRKVNFLNLLVINKYNGHKMSILK